MDINDLPDFRGLPDLRAFEPKMPDLSHLVVRNPLVEAAEGNLASEFHKRLMKWIARFDAELDEEHEVGVRLVSFGQTVTFHLDHIGYWNPSLISFSGLTDDGAPVELIQHVSQISVLLVKLARKDISQPKRIGFNVEE